MMTNLPGQASVVCGGKWTCPQVHLDLSCQGGCSLHATAPFVVRLKVVNDVNNGIDSMYAYMCAAVAMLFDPRRIASVH